jgi:hypothetical protein
MVTIPQNPYVAGNPVGGTRAFVGRAEILDKVEEVLRRPQDSAIVLYGQRRIGKTSLLQHLETHLARVGFCEPVYFDLQDKATWPLGRVLEDLARTIAQALGLFDFDLRFDPETIFYEEWLPGILGGLPEGSCLALLLDEFDVLADPKTGRASETLFPYLSGLLSRSHGRLQSILTIGRNADDLSTVALSLFKDSLHQCVSLLSEEDAASLVRLSEANTTTLYWPDEAVEQVLKLTSGHPYLTQQLCAHVWEQSYEKGAERVPSVNSGDVEAAVPETLDASRSSLEWLWDGLPRTDRVFVSVLAEVGPGSIAQEELEQLLEERDLRVVIQGLQDGLQPLKNWDMIELTPSGYRFRVELLRQWIAEHKYLSRVREELDRTDPVAHSLYQAARELYRGGQSQQAIASLCQAIELNPDHVGASQLLADIRATQERSSLARQLGDLFSIVLSRPRVIAIVFVGTVILFLLLLKTGAFVSVPELYSIDDENVDGSYVVGWSGVDMATHYVLGESTDDACTNPREVYSGPDASYSISGKTEGYYCYCVKACGRLACSGWSNAECVRPWWEHEENNTCSQADGPLVYGLTYHGRHDTDLGDQSWEGWDCFSIDLQKDGQVSAELTTRVDEDLQLHLFDQNCEPVGSAEDLCYDPTPPYELGGPECTVGKGRYYVCIHTKDPRTGRDQYTLTVRFPSTEQ